MNINIKKCFYFLLFLLSSAQGANIAHLNKIVAVVNNDVVTKSELDKKIALINQQLNKNTPALRKQALDSLIDALLQIQLAKRSGIQVSEVDIDNAILSVAKNNGITVEQLKQSLQERENMPFKEYRRQVSEQILINRVEQQFLGRDIVISDKEIESALRNPPKINSTETQAQYHLIDILIELSDDATPGKTKAALNTIQQLEKNLKQNNNIEQIIKKYNTPLQQVQYNDLGLRKIDELPALFAKEVIKMQIGQIVGPLRAPNGLHLIKLLETYGEKPQKIHFTKEQAAEFVSHQKLEKLLGPWLKELRDAAYIKIID